MPRRLILHFYVQLRRMFNHRCQARAVGPVPTSESHGTVRSNNYQRRRIDDVGSTVRISWRAADSAWTKLPEVRSPLTYQVQSQTVTRPNHQNRRFTRRLPPPAKRRNPHPRRLHTPNQGRRKSAVLARETCEAEYPAEPDTAVATHVRPKLLMSLARRTWTPWADNQPRPGSRVYERLVPLNRPVVSSEQRILAVEAGIPPFSVLL